MFINRKTLRFAAVAAFLCALPVGDALARTPTAKDMRAGNRNDITRSFASPDRVDAQRGPTLREVYEEVGIRNCETIALPDGRVARIGPDCGLNQEFSPSDSDWGDEGFYEGWPAFQCGETDDGEEWPALHFFDRRCLGVEANSIINSYILNFLSDRIYADSVGYDQNWVDEFEEELVAQGALEETFHFFSDPVRGAEVATLETPVALIVVHRGSHRNGSEAFWSLTDW